MNIQSRDPLAIVFDGVRVTSGHRALLDNVWGRVVGGRLTAVVSACGARGDVHLLDILAGNMDAISDVAAPPSSPNHSGEDQALLPPPTPAAQPPCIIADGTPVTAKDYRRRTATVDSHLIAKDKLTVRQNLQFSAALRTSHPPSVVAQRVDAVLLHLRLEQHADLPLAQCSKYAHRRVAVARELLLHPIALFIVRAIDSLATYEAQEFLQLLRAAARHYNCAIVISAVQPRWVALSRTDDVLLLHAARTAFCGPTSAFLACAQDFSARRFTALACRDDWPGADPSSSHMVAQDRGSLHDLRHSAGRSPLHAFASPLSPLTSITPGMIERPEVLEAAAALSTLRSAASGVPISPPDLTSPTAARRTASGLGSEGFYSTRSTLAPHSTRQSNADGAGGGGFLSVAPALTALGRWAGIFSAAAPSDHREASSPYGSPRRSIMTSSLDVSAGGATVDEGAVSEYDSDEVGFEEEEEAESSARGVSRKPTFVLDDDDDDAAAGENTRGSKEDTAYAAILQNSSSALFESFVNTIYAVAADPSTSDAVLLQDPAFETAVRPVRAEVLSRITGMSQAQVPPLMPLSPEERRAAAAPWGIVQYVLLLKYAVLSAVNMWTVHAAQFIAFVTLTAFLGIVYQHESFSGPEGSQNRTGLVCFAVLTACLVSVLRAKAGYVRFHRFVRHHKQGYYGALPFTCYRVTVMLFVRAIACVNVAIVLALLERSWRRSGIDVQAWARAALVVSLVSMASSLFVLVVTTLPVIGRFCEHIFMGLFSVSVAFAGIIFNLKTLPEAFRDFSRASILRLGFEAILAVMGSACVPPDDPSGSGSSGSLAVSDLGPACAVLEADLAFLGFASDNEWPNIQLLAIISSSLAFLLWLVTTIAVRFS